jgi:hypothetical protein
MLHRLPAVASGTAALAEVRSRARAPPKQSDRDFIEAVLYIARTGCPWDGKDTHCSRGCSACPFHFKSADDFRVRLGAAKPLYSLTRRL